MNIKNWLYKKGNTPAKALYLFKDFSGQAPDCSHLEPIFITGVGRSGTHFLAELYGANQQIQSFHLDDVGNSVADSFLMYTKWNQIPVDLTGFVASRNYLINSTLEKGMRYLESNPYLAFSVTDLVKWFPKAKFIITYRDPRKCVLSHLNKGWYKNFQPTKESSLPSFYQYQIEKPNHFFGRIFPKEIGQYKDWLKLSQVGKIAWMWQTINNDLDDQLKQLDKKQFIQINIDDFNFDKYVAACDHLGITTDINRTMFEQTASKKPAHTKEKKFAEWDSLSEKDFQVESSKFQLPK